ncbi:MAG: hypothetical protein JO255_21485, partial [Alphaproteobacteria bacterium]|nr:hypothetical protein [Alphaproteobacteria bacterium]
MVAGINYAVDVNSVYHASDLRRQHFAAAYVKRLTDSRYGLASIPYERAVKLELARTAPADCFVLGSSRMLAVNMRTMPLLGEHCRAIANLAMTDGGLEDFITLAGEVLSRTRPRTLVIGFEPWILKYNAGVFWTQLAERYRAARRFFGLSRSSRGSGTASKLANLVNAEYLEQNLRQMWS